MNMVMSAGWDSSWRSDDVSREYCCS